MLEYEQLQRAQATFMDEEGDLTTDLLNSILDEHPDAADSMFIDSEEACTGSEYEVPALLSG